ncbi:MAG TPA: hypothetical protein VF868_10865 [Bacteroidia bacterium]
MEQVSIDKNTFKLRHLPEYAGYLLENKLEEFVLVGIRFARELDLPMLKPLSRIPEKELVAMSLESNKKILSALANGTVAAQIEENLNNWIGNKIKGLDRMEVVAEDLTLAYYIRRRTYSHFLYGYTQSAAIQQQVIDDVDYYTSMEELYSLKVYLGIQQEG